MKFTMISAGAPKHGRNFQKQFQSISDSSGWGWDSRFVEWSDSNGYEEVPYELKSGEALWAIGAFGSLFQWADQNLEPGVQVVSQWIGTDVLQHREAVASGAWDPFRRAVHVADAPHLADEARDLTGQPVGYVRSIPPTVHEPVPITEWRRVVSYVPRTREDFFRYGWIKDVAGDFPDLEFHILRPGIEKGIREGNLIEHPELGAVAVHELLGSCFAFLRPCVHDGVSLTGIEAVQMGRHFLHSDTRIPYTLPARSIGEIEFQLDDLLACRPSQREAAIAFYRSEYTLEALTRDLKHLKTGLGW